MTNRLPVARITRTSSTWGIRIQRLTHGPLAFLDHNNRYERCSMTNAQHEVNRKSTTSSPPVRNLDALYDKSMSRLKACIPIISWLCMSAATGILLLIPTRYRPYLFPVILVPATISYRTIQHLSFIPGLTETWGLITFLGFIHCSSLLYIKRWALRSSTSLGKENRRSIVSRANKRTWTLMYKVATNPRFVKVPYKDVVIPERGGTYQVKSQATHQGFSSARVYRLLVTILIFLFFNYIVTTQLLLPVTINDFAPTKSILLSRLYRSVLHGSKNSISTREIIIRVWFTFNSLCGPILLLEIMHIGLSVFFIHVVGIDTPTDWPDIFGSPLEAYMLSRYWSRYVHTHLDFPSHGCYLH